MEWQGRGKASPGSSQVGAKRHLVEDASSLTRCPGSSVSAPSSPRRCRQQEEQWRRCHCVKSAMSGMIPGHALRVKLSRWAGGKRYVVSEVSLSLHEVICFRPHFRPTSPVTTASARCVCTRCPRLPELPGAPQAGVLTNKHGAIPLDGNEPEEGWRHF